MNDKVFRINWGLGKVKALQEAKVLSPLPQQKPEAACP